ncbi:hypothetical protein QBC37DRAFT_419016 [Rhypophila decipiens]|uniref:Clr5 domain-containing protein n=1 Tax=Rhypophila decipiens TaxID=261697 RepID=A0AAN6YF51_9PEZI|nr:hypothetical protein QBC37DRAFT_419016 [Rhypophila decipiens]
MQKYGTPLPVFSISTLQDDRVTISSRQCENVPQPFPSQTTRLDQGSELSWESWLLDQESELAVDPSSWLLDQEAELAVDLSWLPDIGLVDHPSMSCIGTPDSGYHSLSTTPQGSMLDVDDSTSSTICIPRPKWQCAQFQIDNSTKKSTPEPRKESRRTIRPEHWERHKQTILDLYLRKKKPLLDIEAHMSEKHDFVATRRMYLYRIAKWGVRTNEVLVSDHDPAVPDSTRQNLALSGCDAAIDKEKNQNSPHVAVTDSSSQDAIDSPATKREPEQTNVNTELPVCSVEETTDDIIATSSDEKDPQEDPSFDEADIDSRQREPTPWPECWYDGGMELGLPAFAARIMGECFNKPVPGTPASETQPNSTEAHEPAPEIDGNDRQEQGSGQGSDNTDVHLAFQLESPAPNSQKKRARSSRDGNSQDDEDAPDPKRPATMPPPPDYANQGPFYACPYQKLYPVESPLCGMPHGARRVYGWDSVSRVKQHLLESHGRDHHCSNCWKAYKKVSDAGDCHRKKNCLKRQSPPKIWLSETEASRLRAAKFDSKTADSWYRVFGILSPDKQEHGPEGYRAKYTPYYSRVEYPLPAQFPNFYSGTSPIPGLSPNSIWTPSSNSTNSTVPTPSDPGGTMTTYNGGDTHEESQLRALMMEYEAAVELSHGVPQVDGASNHHTAGDVNMATNINSQFEMLISNPGHDPLDGYANGTTTISVADANTPAAPEQQPDPCRSCSSSSIRRCSPCKLKKRMAHLRADNEGLRTVLAQIRQTVELHDETIQSIDEKNIVPDEIMAKLEGYQDRLRECLASVR